MQMTKKEQRYIESKLAELVKAAEPVFFQLEGTALFNIKRADGSYRMKPVPTDISYQLKDIYFGAKGQAIVVMSPEDARDFEHFEVEAKKADTYLPMLSTELSKLTNLEQPIEKLPNFITQFVTTAVSDHREAEKRAAEAALKNYDNVDDFGAF